MYIVIANMNEDGLAIIEKDGTTDVIGPFIARNKALNWAERNVKTQWDVQRLYNTLQWKKKHKLDDEV